MRLNFKQYSDSGQPLLILHGLFGSLKNWSWHARQLAKDFSVYALDLRNHGDSPHVESMSYPEMAADLLAFLEQQAISQTYVLGHSMGGKAAMQLALNMPERVSRLLVADIAPVSYAEDRGDHENVFDGLLSLDIGKLASRNEADAMLASHIKDQAIRQFLISNLVKNEQSGYRWRFNLSALRQNYASLRGGIDDGRRFEKPVLFVKGALSNYIEKDDWQVIERLFPEARIKTIMGAGHWLHAEKPQVFRKLARDFFISEDEGHDPVER